MDCLSSAEACERPLGLMALSSQEPATGVNPIVLLTCAVCLLTYVVMAVILRKLDQLDVGRARVIPFCGRGGHFKYEILVKTGWGRGAGEGADRGRDLGLAPSGPSGRAPAVRQLLR